MELKLKSLGRKYLLPTLSFSALAITVVIAGLSLGSAPATRKVLVAQTALAEGEPINQSNVATLSIPIGDLGTNYSATLKPGLIASRAIAKGELISKNSMANSSGKRIPVRLNNIPQISKTISVGDVVDVWSMSISQSVLMSPEPAAFNAIVTSIETNTAMAQVSNSVELRILPEYLESLLQVTDSNYKISLILHETLADFE